MPVIPQYKRQIQEQDTPIVRQPMNATPDAYGAGIGQAVSQIGAQVSSIAAKEQEFADTNAVLDASEMFSNKMLDKQSELMSRKGSLANGVSAELEKFYQDESAKVMATLKNKNQVAGFRVRNRTNMFNFMRNIKTHERNEKEAYDNERAEARDKTNTALALIAPDADTFDGVVQTGLLDIRNAAQAMGKPPETIAAQESKFLTGILLGRANIAIDNGAGFDEVREMFRKYGGKADKEKLVDAERKLNKAQNSFNDDAQIDAIVKQYTRADGTVDRAGALAAMQGVIGKGVSVSAPADAAKYFDGNIKGVNGTLVGNMARLAKDKGIKIVVNSGFRTREEQEALYNNRANNPFPVAAPGTSEHENGLAIDTDSLADFSSADLAKYGIKRLEGDEIHYTAIGASGGASNDPARARSFEAKLKAKIADAEWVRADRINQAKKEISLTLPSLKTVAEKIKYIESVPEEVMSYDTKQKAIENEIKKDEKASKGHLTQGEMFWRDYDKTGQKADLARIYEFQAKLAEGKTLDEKDLEEYRRKSTKIKTLWLIQQGKLDPDQAFAGDASPAGSRGAMRYQLRAKYPDRTDAEIDAYLDEQYPELK